MLDLTNAQQKIKSERPFALPWLTLHVRTFYFQFLTLKVSYAIEVISTVHSCDRFVQDSIRRYSCVVIFL